MNFLKKLGCAAAFSMAFAGAASAAPVLNDWVFNPNGGGYAAGQTINEHLDVVGNAFIQITPNEVGGFTFRENAVFNITQADSNGQLFPVNYGGGYITATFSAYGSGTLGGNFAFEGGTITIYQNTSNQYGSTAGNYGADQGTVIATFDVLAGGGGRVDAEGNPLDNGNVSVFAKADAGDLAPGYFFLGDGTDLSTTALLSFAFTNANTVSSPTNTLVNEVACGYAGFTGNGCNGTAYSNAAGAYFFVSNNGQFKLAEVIQEVPEPGSLALFGIAMLGAGVASRKRAKKA